METGTSGWPARALAYLKGSWRTHLGTVALALVAMLAVNARQTRHAPSGQAPISLPPLCWGPGTAPLLAWPTAQN